MPCPSCGAESRVFDSRGTRRRRRCPECDHRWTTYEVSRNELETLRTNARKAARKVPFSLDGGWSTIQRVALLEQATGLRVADALAGAATPETERIIDEELRAQWTHALRAVGIWVKEGKVAYPTPPQSVRIPNGIWTGSSKRHTWWDERGRAR